MLFNSFYDNFKDLENIEILGFKIPKISILINFIKRMFNYSFINLYSDVFEEIITELFDLMTNKFESVTTNKIDTLNADKTKDNKIKINFLENLRNEVVDSITSARAKINLYKDNIRDKQINPKLLDELLFKPTKVNDEYDLKTKVELPQITSSLANYKDVMDKIANMKEVDDPTLLDDGLKKIYSAYIYLLNKHTINKTSK